MTYLQLSQEERYFLSSLLARGASIPSIAKELGRAPSTLYRELKRNLRPSGQYAASVAHSYATARRRRSRRGSQFPKECWDMILHLIQQQWSPEQIVHHLRKTSPYHISVQTIYRRIRKDRRHGGTIYKDLRIVPKRRRKRYRSEDSRGVLRGKRIISERPNVINNRLEFGHWEADTVMGKDKHQCVLTMVERMTGYNKMVKLSNRTAILTTKALSRIIGSQPDTFKTITFDNGTEFHSYKDLEEKFSLTCYFSNPHHPWERGSVENFNGLLRQYLPKGASLDNLTPQRLDAICKRLNTRPRKRLGFISPKEAFHALC
jgi:IS30 family transposase